MHENTHLTFWEHIEELRRVLLKVLFIIIVGSCIAFAFYESIFKLITIPFQKTLSENLASNLTFSKLQSELISNKGNLEQEYQLPEGAILKRSFSGVKEKLPNIYILPPGASIEVEKTVPIKSNPQKLVIFGPSEGMWIACKVSIWIGIVLTSPLWLYVILQFILPALEKSSQFLIMAFLIISMCFLSLGFLFSYFVTIPLANQYLYAFNEGMGTNVWSLSHYVDYTILLFLANGIGFECCVLLLFLVHLKILTADMLLSKRRHAILIAFIVGALLTPPDVLTQFMLAIPLIILYEGAIFYAKILMISKKSIMIKH